jgi:hypothetical protein
VGVVGAVLGIFFYRRRQAPVGMTELDDVSTNTLSGIALGEKIGEGL